MSRTPEEIALNTEYQRRWREKQRALGRRNTNLYLTKDELQLVKEFLANLRNDTMKIRLTHATRRAFGSKVTHHVWVGQIYDAPHSIEKGLWEDYTNDYDNEKDAERALLRNIVEDYLGAEHMPTFERGELK